MVSFDRVAAKAELRRLVMARFDIEAARDLCGLLEERGHIDGLDWGSVAWGLWTGVVCSYARPFKKATLQLKGEEWTTFDDDRLQQLHCRLIHLRDTLLAHNDATAHRKVVVFPPRAWGPQSPGSAREEQAVFSHDSIADARSLCDTQLARMDPRIEELVGMLCEGLEYAPGSIVDLAEIPERL
jgi:hypothetical protein